MKRYFSMGKTSFSSGIDAAEEWEEKAALAASLSVPWPPGKLTAGRGAGRYPFQLLWEQALSQHILHKHELPDGVRKKRPQWWKPGDPLTKPLRGEEVAAVAAETVIPEIEAEEAGAGAETMPEPGTEPKRRKKNFIHPHVERLVSGHVGFLVRARMVAEPELGRSEEVVPIPVLKLVFKM